MKRPAAALVLALLVLAGPGAAQVELSSATLPPVGDHWVWVTDQLFTHSKLYDGDSGEVLAIVDGGTTISPKPPILSAARDAFYSVEIDYARGHRGERTDYVTIYDGTTLEVTDEVVLPTRTSESAASIGYAALLDGGRFLATFNQLPHTSVSITDLEARRFVGEIVTAGCAGIYPTGERRFAMLCGDGTVLSVSLDEEGRQLAMDSSEPFFDAVEDPVMMGGSRLDDRWVFVSYAGVAHEVDFATAPPAIRSWPLLDAAEREAGWRPGGRQLTALHRDSGRFFVIFHRGKPGSHKQPGPEVWVFDLARRERVGRFAMPNFTAAFLGGNLGVEQGGIAAWLLAALLPDAGADTITVSQDAAPLLFARNSTLGAVAVLDARSGDHLRDLTEVGLGGTRLEVP